MAKKYIYGKRKAENLFLVRENEFNFLCKYLGAYLKYEKEKDFHKNFEEYLSKYNVREAISTKVCWGYINEAQKYIRDKYNESQETKIVNNLNITEKHRISRMEIRKLGYYGGLSVPVMPKSACVIETELFNTIYNDKKFNDVATCFDDYLYDAWERNDNRERYFTDENINALNVTTMYFIGFQQIVINDNPLKYKKLFKDFKSNFGFKFVQKGLDERHS